jgi:MFS family permease
MKKILGFPKNVFVLGVVSFFMDVSSEMIYPLIPIFLSDVLHASKTSIGLIEGIAESTASILKVFSGWLSDRLGKRKSIIFWGYGISVLSRPLLAGAGSWIGVLVYRFTDRVGKGVRTAPRDAIIADVTEKESLGKAFGFHRAMDTMGAMAGPAIAFALLLALNNNMRAVFWISMIPGVLALITIALFVEEVKKQRAHEKPHPTLGGLEKRFKYFLIVSGLFTLGRASDAFLVLRANEMGMGLHVIPILYLSFNTVSAALSTPAGMLADRFGKRNTIFVSYILFALIFFGFARADTQAHIWGLFLAYGAFVAINEGVQRAFVATVISPEMKATGYGIYHMVVGLAALPASIIGGALWQNIGPQALFYYGACMAVAASVVFGVLLMRGEAA